MSDPAPLPRYISRAEEQQIIQYAEHVSGGKSRALLLYGPGGTGKTRLIRHLPHNRDVSPEITWLDPIDVDDSQHLLLSNLELHVAAQLDPDDQYFGEYRKYVSALPQHSGMATNRDTVLSRLNRIKAIFARCYMKYIDGTGKTVVITFDTVEAIHGMYILRTLTQWMKDLPGTLFIFAGRPLADAADWRQSIRSSLEDPPQDIEVNELPLGEFSLEACRDYLSHLSKEAHLSDDQIATLICLTQGHPLWLALTVSYVAEFGMPEEADVPVQSVMDDLPYRGRPTAAGRARAESFKRRLVAPYQGADFWHEAIKRLAVIRESISEPIWERLMADRPRPDNAVDLADVWEDLRQTEWIRPRANHRYVTLHDALAEELARRIIPVQDPDGKWRHGLWETAASIYADQVHDLENQLSMQQAAVDRRLHALDLAPAEHGSRRQRSQEEAELILDVTELDGRKQELNQLKAAHLFYLLLSDFQAGARQFVSLLGQAREGHDVLFEDLLVFQMQRFMPGEAGTSALDDTVGAIIGRFRSWLENEGRDSYIEVGLAMAAYLIEREQHQAAHTLLDHLPIPAPDHQRLYRRYNLQGNACLRIPGRARASGKHFRDALAEARQIELPAQHKEIAEAYKELGFYYRNIGHWEKADDAYRKARDAISRTLSAQSPDSDREELASIHNNWAYLKGIGGSYDDGINLIESAIAVRRRLKRYHEQAVSCSVKGEVYRYKGQFKEAWNAYSEAEQLFQEQSSWSWLGMIYQEQAICLFQSIPAGVLLLKRQQDHIKRARSLIRESLDLCRDLNVRAYPSALNRAGRIFGDKDPALGLRYLRQGADQAKDISDGWFWMANLIEYAELAYRAWDKTQGTAFLELIPDIADELQDAEEQELEFPELRGRWNVLQGHLAMHTALDSDGSEAQESALAAALESYKTGFPLITHGWVGSYGVSAIPEEFGKLSRLVWQLPPEIRERWQQELSRAWGSEEASVTQLLARLEELY